MLDVADIVRITALTRREIATAFGTREMAIATAPAAVPPPSGPDSITGAVGFTVSDAGDLLIGYAGAEPAVTIDADGYLLLEV